MSTITTGAPPRATPNALPGGRVGGRANPLLRHFSHIDQAAILGWVLVTTVPAEWAAPIRYMLTAYFFGALIVRARQTMPVYVRAWPTLILPVMCFVSTIWAPSVPEAMRFGVFMALTGAIAVYVASRLSGRQIMAIYFLGETFGALLSLLYPNIEGGNWTGVFGQKNFLAMHMFIMCATGLALLVDRETNRWLRMATMVFVPIGATLIILAHSATTLLLLGGSTIALLGHAFIWQPASRVPHMRAFIVMFVAVIGSAVGIILFGIMQFDAENTALAALGKDETLTGRTFLWQIAHRVMDEHPLTGVGAVGFWRPELGAANEITRFFFYAHYTKFSFHNSYLENGVQFGYPGYYATYFIAAWGLWNCFRTWIKNQTLPNAAFLILAVMVVIRSNAEVDLASELGATAILFFVGAIRKEKLLPPPPVSTLPEHQPQTPANHYRGQWRKSST